MSMLIAKQFSKFFQGAVPAIWDRRAGQLYVPTNFDDGEIVPDPKAFERAVGELTYQDGNPGGLFEGLVTHADPSELVVDFSLIKKISLHVVINTQKVIWVDCKELSFAEGPDPRD